MVPAVVDTATQAVQTTQAGQTMHTKCGVGRQRDDPTNPQHVHGQPQPVHMNRTKTIKLEAT